MKMEWMQLMRPLGGGCCRSQAIILNFLTMEELAVSFCTPVMKEQFKLWLKKGLRGPIIAKVQANRTKQKVKTFFCNKGHNYTNFLPRGTMVSVNNMVEAQGKFMKTF
jgi:hypothetical protein